MYLKIVKSSGSEWYKKCIGKMFKVHSESKKGGKGKYIVRLEKDDRWLMNGYIYGWVDKKHFKTNDVREITRKEFNRLEKEYCGV